MAGGITAEYVSVNGLARAERTGSDPAVAKTGTAPVIRAARVKGAWQRAGAYASTWVVPQDESLVP